MHYRLSILFMIILVFGGGFFAGCQTQKYRDSIAEVHAENKSADFHYKSNSYLGATEAALSQELGKPLTDVAGYEPLALETPDSLPGNIRTLRYRAKNGTLWIWLEERGDHWGCFESCWFEDGVVF